MIDTQSLIINAESVAVENDPGFLFHQLEKELNNSKVKGVGLAAVQIGILERAAIIRIPGGLSFNIYNPRILESEGIQIAPEGCLSFPGISRSVGRPQSLTFENGDGRRYVLTDFEAVVFSHEFDHLLGITILEKEMRSQKVGRNEPCPCGKRNLNGNIIKYKKCCGK